MKTKAIHLSFNLLMLFALLLSSCNSASAEDLRRIVTLTGDWKFSIGDNSKWADPDFNDSGWDKIRVPNSWENEGYNDYNGYAWYRKKFSISDVSSQEPIYLLLGKIDDADEIYLNGKLLGKNGGFPPNFITAYNQQRRYTLSHEDLKFNGENTIAIKVYDSYSDGGITNGKVGIYIDEDNSFLDIVLSGEWKFNTGDNKFWRTSEFNDKNWKTVHVPSEWEHTGNPDYDGYAWYRKTFSISSKELLKEELYLSMGKIDDYDQVYVNGKLIGNVFDLKKDSEYRSKGWEYNARRVYKIPSGILNPGENTIAVRVYDKELRGGIYEGPIGIMTESNYKIYYRKHYKSRSFWDYMYEEFFLD